MLPEVTGPAPSIEEVQRAQALPSDLFVGVDRRAGVAMIKGEIVPLDQLTDQFDFGNYKSNRIQIPFHSPFDRVCQRFFVDMEDARLIPTEFYFGRNFNVFQYNRRRGDRTSVLWRLRPHFEPNRRIGFPPNLVGNDDIDFRDKEPIIYWRGGMSGSVWVDPHKRTGVRLQPGEFPNQDQMRLNSRINLVFNLGHRLPFIDAQFAGRTVAGHLAESSPYFEEQVEPHEFLRYKYLLSPAGNDVSSALYWIASTNSLAFKEETPYEILPDYFLKPWVHYVPISQGLNDITEKFAYCERNPGLCETIVRNAHEAYEQMIDSDVWIDAEQEVLTRMGLG